MDEENKAFTQAQEEEGKKLDKQRVLERVPRPQMELRNLAQSQSLLLPEAMLPSIPSLSEPLASQPGCFGCPLLERSVSLEPIVPSQISVKKAGERNTAYGSSLSPKLFSSSHS